MILQSRYFHSEVPTGSRTTCIWGSCHYPWGDYWNWSAYRRITLTLTSSSGPISHISMYAWTGTLPAVTAYTVENFLDLGSSPTPGSHATADFPTGTDGFSIEIDAADSAYPLDVRVDFELIAGDTNYCQYGTRLKPFVQQGAVITEAGIAGLVELGLASPWLAIIFGALVGLSWTPGIVCDGPPPPMPDFGSIKLFPGTDIPRPESLPTVMQAWQAANWPLWCECLPATGGGPPPVVYPPLPPDPAPPLLPVPIAPLVCDNTNLCDALDQLNRQLTAMSGQLAAVRQDVTLIQRQSVPFAYLYGTVHSALSGEGSFSVQGIIGLSVTFDTLPALYPPYASEPDTYHQLGKLTLGTADGWTRSWQPTHSPYLILPVSGAFTLVGWNFAPGIVATITELVREP